jgi:hypothetical protein
MLFSLEKIQRGWLIWQSEPSIPGTTDIIALAIQCSRYC